MSTDTLTAESEQLLADQHAQYRGIPQVVLRDRLHAIEAAARKPLEERVRELEAALGEVYADRNLVVQAFAKAQEEADWPVAWGVDESEPDWPVLYIETGAGQVSWHIPVAERAYEPPERPGFVATWDGHTNEQKAERLRAALREPVR